MGWTYTHKDKGVTGEAFFRHEFPTMEFLGCATVNRVFYAAVRSPSNPSEVWALVCLTNYCRGEFNFGYKDMSEHMGPYEAKCPASILGLLTPTDSEYANDWRARCRDYAERAAKAPVAPGTVVKFTEPIKFTDGYEGTTFKAVRYRKRGLAFEAPTGRLYRVTNYKNREFAVEAA